jgi:hypothetical protein
MVWQLALTGDGRSAQHDRFAVALALLRAAHHSPATMLHALALGTSHVHAHPDDAVARRGVAVLEAAIAFLGVKPRAGEIAPGATKRWPADDHPPRSGRALRLVGPEGLR